MFGWSLKRLFQTKEFTPIYPNLLFLVAINKPKNSNPSKERRSWSWPPMSSIWRSRHWSCPRRNGSTQLDIFDTRKSPKRLENTRILQDFSRETMRNSYISPPVRWGLLDFMIFYVSWPPSPPPDLNCKLVTTVVPAGPEQQAQDQSVPRRTSTTKNLRRYSR